MSGHALPPAPEGAALRFFYGSLPGRILLKALTARPVSVAAGRFMDSGLSRPLIRPFIRRNGIRMAEYLPMRYTCFNAFFCRPVRPELRPFPDEAAAFMAPCDGLLSAYRITDGLVLPIKQGRYTVEELLGGDAAAETFRDGVCLVFRLCVNHYHRYAYADDGVILKKQFLPGVLHTVRPIALSALPVFTQNCREYMLLDTAHFGSLAQIEVGAMLVGKIENYKGEGVPFRRGEEKGRFLYGGSTVVVLLEENRVQLDEALFENTARGLETPVILGEVLGRAVGPCRADAGARKAPN